MYAVEFNAKVDDGRINIPKQHINDFISDVKVILLRLDNTLPDNSVAKTELKAFGALSHRANPKLWEQEETAMEKALVNNYEADVWFI